MGFYRIFDSLPLTWFFFLTAGLLMAAVELGTWFARKNNKRDEHQSPVESLVTATLGLLAFILAFTFSMTNVRFDQRRQLVLDEANAIRSLYQTASLVEAPEASQIQRLLRDYLQNRLELNRSNLAERLAKSAIIQGELWKQMASLNRKRVEPDLKGTLVGNLNQLMSLHQSRKTVGLTYRIPPGIWASLFALSLIAMLTIGYQVGILSRRRVLGMPALVLAISLVIYMIADTDRPGEGQFKIGDDSLRDVQSLMTRP